METVKYEIEVTDTFAGEPNYCWVKRKTVDVPEFGNRRNAFRRRMIREVREVAGWPAKHYRLDVFDYGVDLELRPRGLCQVAFALCKED